MLQVTATRAAGFERTDKKLITNGDNDHVVVVTCVTIEERGVGLF